MNAYEVFYEEITKSSAVAKAIGQAARWLSESPARTALLGAGVGAAHGVLTRGDESAGSAAMKGGIRGAAIGGAGGMLGRSYRDTRLLNPTLSGAEAVGATAKRVGEGIKNFGKRQLHGFTGAYEDRASQIGLRSTGEADRRIELLKLRQADVKSHGGLTDKVKKDFAEKILSLHEWCRGGDQALRSGITSIPGVIGNLATRPIHTAKALGRSVTGGSGAQGMALGLGLPLAISAPDLAKGDESARGGRTMRQKLVGAGSGLAGGMLTAGMPIIPQIVGSSAVDSIASRQFGGKRLARASHDAGQASVNRTLGVPGGG